ncbi:hypothetical protein V6Z12_A11G196300 [Gossypium hirsutum]
MVSTLSNNPIELPPIPAMLKFITKTTSFKALFKIFFFDKRGTTRIINNVGITNFPKNDSSILPGMQNTRASNHFLFKRIVKYGVKTQQSTCRYLTRSGKKIINNTSSNRFPKLKFESPIWPIHLHPCCGIRDDKSIPLTPPELSLRLSTLISPDTIDPASLIGFFPIAFPTLSIPKSIDPFLAGTLSSFEFIIPDPFTKEELASIAFKLLLPTLALT